MAKSLRILVVSDIHHRSVDAPPKLCSHGLQLLEPVISQTMSGEYDLLVDLGDRIEELGPEEDIGLAKDIAAVFMQARVPRVHLMGNHDSYFLTAGHWSDILQTEVGSKIMEIAGYRLIFFCPDVNNQRGRHDYNLAPSELEWLSGALAVGIADHDFLACAIAGRTALRELLFRRQARPCGVSQCRRCQNDDFQQQCDFIFIRSCALEHVA